MARLTKKTGRIEDLLLLKFISDYWVANGYSPNYREISEGMDLGTTSTVKNRVVRLANKKYIRHNPPLSRTISLTMRGKRYLYSGRHKKVLKPIFKE